MKNIEELVKSVYRSGFLAGKNAGIEMATAYERGDKSNVSATAEESWEEDIQWRIDTNTDMKLDITNAEQWKEI